MTESSQGKKDRVLIIDDEHNMVYIVKAGLERKGLALQNFQTRVISVINFRHQDA
jgi:hypothetical protein